MYHVPRCQIPESVYKHGPCKQTYPHYSPPSVLFSTTMTASSRSSPERLLAPPPVCSRDDCCVAPAVFTLSPPRQYTHHPSFLARPITLCMPARPPLTQRTSSQNGDTNAQVTVASVTLANFPKSVFSAFVRHTTVTVLGTDVIQNSQPVATAMGPSITQNTARPTNRLVTLWNVVWQHQSMINIGELNTHCMTLKGEGRRSISTNDT